MLDYFGSLTSAAASRRRQRARMFRELPRILVIGGQCRRVGKTLLAADVIRSFPECDWLALKITHHYADEKDAAPFAFEAETGRSGNSDTSRFLAAGATRAFLLRIRPGHFAEAAPELNRLAGSAGNVIVESNRVLDFLVPALALLVLDPRRGDFKVSARRFLALADALVVRSPMQAHGWPHIDSGLIRSKPCFIQPIGAPMRLAVRQLVGRALAR